MRLATESFEKSYGPLGGTSRSVPSRSSTGLTLTGAITLMGPAGTKGFGVNEL
jgi:hypothetical protein